MAKRIISLCFAILLLILPCISLVSCSSSDGKETKTLYVYNWGEYISDGSEDSYDTNTEFESYFNENLSDKYGFNIDVSYTTYASNEDMYNKLVSGSAKYDVIIPSDYMIERLKNEGMLYKFNPAETVENYKYITEDFKNLFYDEENMYSVPYAYGVVGVIYNTDYVSEESDGFGTWNLLWNEEYTGKILQYNGLRDAFATAMYKNHIDVNTQSKADWDKALSDLKLQKPLVQSYVQDEIFNKMQTGSAWIASYYAGDFITMYGNNDSLEFYYPEDGTNIYIDAMCIPANAENPEIAIEYINFMLSEETAIANAEYTCYATPNVLVSENEEYKAYLEDCYEGAYDMLYCDVTQINKDTDYSDKSHTYVSYYHAVENTEENGDLLNYTNSLWEELKIESSNSSWVYVAAGIIVLILIAWAVYLIAIKKKRESRY